MSWWSINFLQGNCIYVVIYLINNILFNLMKWNILVIRGKETKKYSVSTGEGIWINKI